MAKVLAVIFDIDGTLADCKHRRHYVESKPKNWDAFYAGISEDKPNPMPTRMFYNAHHDGFERLIVTGRPERYREKTFLWLCSHLSPYIKNGEIYMRPDGDFTPDDELKRNIYEAYIEPNYDVKLVLDDRDRVVKMWRSLGLECWQVAEGNF